MASASASASSEPPPSFAESTTGTAAVGSSTGRRSISTRGRYTPSTSTLRAVVTAPPWAKDEPESPTLDEFSFDRSPRPSGVSTTHVPSIISSERPSVSTENLAGHHRWTFALPRPRPKPKRRRVSASSSESSEDDCTHQGAHSRTPRPRWHNSRKLTQTSHQSDAPPPARPSRKDALRLQLPLPQQHPSFTISHSKTPGWNTPWTPRVPEQAHSEVGNGAFGPDNEVGASQTWTSNTGNVLYTKEEPSKPEADGLSQWSRTKKKLRSFLLHNNHIPLVSRLINLTFTTITLAIAIRIRLIEKDHHLRGAVGSSPVLAIIFAPLTLVHIMIAIYLEYFGRPLGLWRTSAKLAHTLSEVLFICAWSAELSLCFDNYFTSPLQCAPHSATRWYSDLPPSSNPLGNNVTGDLAEDARTLCSYQLDLIGVVMVALLLYCTNLVISLFRIFEKVKVHQGWGRRV